MCEFQRDYQIIPHFCVLTIFPSVFFLQESKKKLQYFFLERHPVIFTDYVCVNLSGEECDGGDVLS